MAFGFGGGGEQAQSSYENNPWAAQSPYLTGGFEQAENLMNRDPYGGDWYANPNDMQNAAMAGGGAWGAAGQGYGENLMNMGQNWMQGGDQANDFWRKQMQAGSQIENPYGGDQYNQMVQDNMWGPQYQNMLDNANSNIMDMQAMQDKDARLGASMSGLSGGSGQMQKYAASALGAQNQSSDIENRLRMQGQQYGTQQANQWAGADLNNQMQDWQSRAGGANQLGQMAQQGAGMYGTGYDMGRQGYSDQMGYGNAQYGMDQDRIQGEQAQYNEPWNNLQNYWNVVGGSSWGGEGSTQSSGTNWNADASYGT